MDECACYDIVIGGVTSGIGYSYRRLDWLHVRVRLSYVWSAGLCVHVLEIYLSLYCLVLSKIDYREERTVLQLSINVNHFEGVHSVLLFDLSNWRRRWRRRALLFTIIIVYSFYLGQAFQMTATFCKVSKLITTSTRVSETWTRSLFVVLVAMSLPFSLRAMANELL